MKKIMLFITILTIITSSHATLVHSVAARMFRRTPQLNISKRMTFHNGRKTVYSPEQQFLDWHEDTQDAQERLDDCFDLKKSELIEKAIKERETFGTNHELLQKWANSELSSFTDQFISEQADSQEFMSKLSPEERKEYINTIKEEIEKSKKEILAHLKCHKITGGGNFGDLEKERKNYVDLSDC